MPRRDGEVLDDHWGLTTFFHYDEAEDKVTLEYEEDVEPVLNRNKELLNHGGDGYSPSRDIRRVASIPPSVQLKWLLEEGIDIFDPNCKEAVRRKLNSVEWRHLRTAPGVL